MQIMDDSESMANESMSSSRMQGACRQVLSSDEFLRNFLIKFGMKNTLESFQTEWYELRAKGELHDDKMPQVPEIYKRN
jgi:hypothetical protein